MICPKDRLGRSDCHITAHPDRPHMKFCSKCQRKFKEENIADLSLIPLLILLLPFLFILI